MKRLNLAVQAGAGGEIALFQKVVYHALQAHLPSVVGRIKAGDAVLLQRIYFIGQNGAAAAAEYFDMPGAARLQQVVHVFEKLVVAALVAGDGDALHVFLNGGVHDFLHRAVVAEVDDFRPRRLQDAPHDVDGGVVPVEERGGGDEADFVAGVVGLNGLHVHSVVLPVIRLVFFFKKKLLAFTSNNK